MDINILQEVYDSCRHAVNTGGLSRSQMEVYGLLANQFNLLLQSSEEQRIILQHILYQAEETGNQHLAESLHNLVHRLNSECEALEDIRRCCNLISS